MNDPTQLDRIEKKLDALFNLHSSRTRKPRQRVVSDDRPREMMRVFEGLCTLPDFKKEMQKFPYGTFHNGKMKGHTEIVPRSILINRASMRGAFKPDREEMLSKNAAAIASEILDELISKGDLIEMTLDSTALATSSKVTCIFSPRWARLATDKTPYLPQEEKDRRSKLKKPVVIFEEEEWDDEAELKKFNESPDNAPHAPVGDFLRSRGIAVPEIPQTPLELPSTAQETPFDVSEEELIKQMQEAEVVGRLADDVVFERSDEPKGRVKL